MSPKFILPGIFVLGIVIFVHELGHFLVAKWRGVRVLKFSLGFGPPLVKVTRGETEYRLSWIPLGGYVQMAGDTPGEDGSMPDRREEFLSHPWFGRFLIAVAGPAANLVTAFVAMVVTALVGVSFVDYPNVVGTLPDTSSAYAAGFRAGDRIVAIDTTRVSTWTQMSVAQYELDERRPVTVRAERAGVPVTLEISADSRGPVFRGLRPPSDPPVVGAVRTGMPAYKAGIKEGDRIRKVNGRPIGVWEELPDAFLGQVDKPVTLEVERDGRVFELQVTPINPEGKRGAAQAQIGIAPPRHGVYVRRHGLMRSIELGFGATGDLVASVYRGMWLTVSRPLYYREYLGGPLFIVQAASESARQGFDSWLQFLALINVAIMAFNLLPIPVLDGGHIALALLQAVRGQGISARGYIRFQKVGLVVIGTLFVLILANDPLRVFQRQRALDKAPQEERIAPSPP